MFKLADSFAKQFLDRKIKLNVLYTIAIDTMTSLKLLGYYIIIVNTIQT